MTAAWFIAVCVSPPSLWTVVGSGSWEGWSSWCPLEISPLPWPPSRSDPCRCTTPLRWASQLLPRRWRSGECVCVCVWVWVGVCVNSFLGWRQECSLWVHSFRSVDVWGLGCLLWEVYNGPLLQAASLKSPLKVGRFEK